MVTQHQQSSPGAGPSFASISLRPPFLADAKRLADAGDYAEVADTMISVPSPFRIEDAEAWIAETSARSDIDSYVISSEVDNSIVGAAELRDIDLRHRQAEASFWITPQYWGQGYASVALAELVRIGVDRHGLNRIYAYHMARNPASGRVLSKCGFHFEGRLRERVWKSGCAEDAMLWSRLASDLPRIDILA
ncbi:MAG TPA: GNAT family protein [Sphingomicrobium sp.]|nr:GNAT family protein [Sphingomicrobium sp.]